MAENLVIVESPAKAKTIEKFLGKDFHVVSSYGHIRDLAKKNLGIEIENNYNPQYIVSEDKKKVVSELKKQVKIHKTVWLASDEDREGEAIAWHLAEALSLSEKNTRRIVFHEITKDAITQALKTPRYINQNLVNAQQARRVLDRLVGFELSPVLWKKVKPSLSAGRVQSVAVRLLVEREREILNFKSESTYRVSAIFTFKGDDGKPAELKAVLTDKLKSKKEADEFLRLCVNAEFKVSQITTKPSKKSPSPPFTTSTLQQEASRKLGFSVSQTMTVAQKLYESGHITYMRTDSVNLSQLALNASKKVIVEEFGKEYSNTHNYKTKSKGAQEAHEAIRPTYLNKKEIKGNNSEERLYDLIWKRTIASQMSDAQLEKTNVTIEVSNSDRKFISTGEVIKFDGFLKLYIESTDDESDESSGGLLPRMKENQALNYTEIIAQEKYSHHPPRYTEASLVKKLEELGIGRPSTYAPIISTIQQRGYVVKENRPGTEIKVNEILLKTRKITSREKTEMTGVEKAKLFPNNIGMVVNDFLLDHFEDIMNYNFTASVEEEFDKIAEGQIDWQKMIDVFYKAFHPTVEKTLETSDYTKGERLLGNDPQSGDPVYVRIGRYGPIAQIGSGDDESKKPRFASLLKGQLIESISLEEALNLFKLPRNLGEFEDKEVIVNTGRFGPYVLHNSKFVSLKKEDDPFSIELDRAIELIKEKQEKDKNRIVKIFEEDKDLQILNGRYGPYISYKKANFRIPKGKDPKSLTHKDCIEIMEKSDKKKNKSGKK